jgi:hypothetical protein
LAPRRGNSVRNFWSKMLSLTFTAAQAHWVKAQAQTLEAVRRVPLSNSTRLRRTSSR